MRTCIASQDSYAGESLQSLDCRFREFDMVVNTGRSTTDNSPKRVQYRRKYLHVPIVAIVILSSLQNGFTDVFPISSSSSRLNTSKILQ
ncbi:hypothetical protein NPIL_616021 [Nephila pilipes]|uniref:Uncharacterized protein n=1 Tax=Nephila pilipes TaxID=299642 RepID=A0A8X6TNY9_NEPPI|nr:hypothetical protein NPIL_616021 [Nephila pilipes]